MKNDIIGLNLAFLRHWRNYTQEQIADELSLPRITYAFYETGRTVVPLEVIDQIARFYAVPVDLILTEDLSLCRFSPYELYDTDSLEEQLAKYCRLSLISRCLVLERMRTLVEVESSLYGNIDW